MPPPSRNGAPSCKYAPLPPNSTKGNLWMEYRNSLRGSTTSSSYPAEKFPLWRGRSRKLVILSYYYYKILIETLVCTVCLGQELTWWTGWYKIKMKIETWLVHFVPFWYQSGFNFGIDFQYFHYLSINSGPYFLTPLHTPEIDDYMNQRHNGRIDWINSHISW